MKNVVYKFILLTFFLFVGYKAKSQTNVKVIRFDSILMFDRNVIPQYKELQEFSDLLSNVLFKNRDEIEEPSQDRLFKFYNSYESLKNLYNDTQKIYKYNYRNELDSNMIVLDYSLERLQTIAPHLPRVSKVFLFVSAFHENIIVDNDIIAIALDRYLGKDYYMYTKAMTKWKRQMSDVHRMPLDAIRGFLVSNMPMYKDKLLTNIDYIRYWANIYNILSKVFDDYCEKDLFGFTDTQYQWIQKNIKRIYNNAISKGDLNTYNTSIIDKYFGELPSDKVLPKEAPRQIGQYLSYWMFKTNKLN